LHWLGNIVLAFWQSADVCGGKHQPGGGQSAITNGDVGFFVQKQLTVDLPTLNDGVYGRILFPFAICPAGSRRC
jgi:hypothetical protein